MKQRRLKKTTVYLLYSAVFIFLVAAAYLIEGGLTKNKLKDTDYVNKTILEEKIKPVVAQYKKIIRPYKDTEIKVLREFYDYKGNEENQVNSLIEYNDTYLQSTGVCYGGKEEFEVNAILDGKVVDVKQDETLGNIVQIEHENNVISVYQSLKDVKVRIGDMVAQGDVIASAGTNNLNKDLNNHLCFELLIDGVNVNPENYYDKTINEIKG